MSVLLMVSARLDSRRDIYVPLITSSRKQPVFQCLPWHPPEYQGCHMKVGSSRLKSRQGLKDPRTSPPFKYSRLASAF
jgi:hypothetical protein